MISMILAAAAFLGSLQQADALFITRAEITAEQVHKDLNTPPCLVLSYGIIEDRVFQQEVLDHLGEEGQMVRLRATMLRIWVPKTRDTDVEWNQLATELSPPFSIIRDVYWSRRPATP
jgi:hypothetical protein